MALRLGSQTRKDAFGDPLMGKMPMLRFRRGADLLDRVDAIGQIAV